MNDIYAINVAKTEFREGCNTGQVDRVMAVFGDKVTDFSDGFPSFFGDEGTCVLRRRLERLFHACHVRLVVTIIDIEILGDTAIEYGWHEWTLTPKASGAASMIRERYVDIWRRKADGAWKLSLYINNADHQPEMPDSDRALESADMKALLAGVPGAISAWRQAGPADVR
jgi:ketosteroid isomerase-like protein